MTAQSRIHDYGHGLMPAEATQRFVEATCEHIECRKALGMDNLPKANVFMELAARIVWLGAPSAYGCWKDESLNGDLKPICQQAHRLVWAKRVLATWKRAHGIGQRKRLREPARASSART